MIEEVARRLHYKWYSVTINIKDDRFRSGIMPEYIDLFTSIDGYNFKDKKLYVFEEDKGDNWKTIYIATMNKSIIQKINREINLIKFVSSEPPTSEQIYQVNELNEND